MKLLLTILFAGLLSVYSAAQIIVLDPGHGYGATTSDNPDGRTATEIETALEVGLRTRTLIQNNCTWTVHMTRTTNLNGWISVNQRAQMSNNWNADRFLSIHGNAGGGTGTETFYCNIDNPVTSDDIAFAQKIQADMVNYGQWNNRRCVEDDSYLNYHLGVLRYSSAVSCLNEIGFVDHSGDAAKLNSTTWRDSFANAYYQALQSNLNFTCTSTPLPGAFTLTVTPECNGTTTQIRLNWTSSSNATSYEIYRNGSLYTTITSGTQFINTFVTTGTSYTYYIKAKNTSGGTNNSNGTLSGTAPLCTPPGSFTLTLTPECNGTTSQIRLNWDASSDAASYELYRNGNLYTTIAAGTTQFINTYVTVGTSYTYSVKAINTAGSTNNSNGTLSATAPNCTNPLPGAFTLTLTPECNGSTRQIRLNWGTSSNATSYEIYRNGSLYTTITGTQFLNTAVTSGTTYSYYVKAKNTAGSTNNSNGTLSATAPACTGGRAATGLPAEKEDEQFSVKLFPNPSSGIYRLLISNTRDEAITVEVVNQAGQRVYYNGAKNASDSYSQLIDLRHLPNGIYFARIITGGRQYTRQLIKQ